MQHMVIFRVADGRPSYQQAEALDDAVRLVEHLRNDEHIEDARIFAMQEVGIEFKAYYRVEVCPPSASAAEPPVPPSEDERVAVAVGGPSEQGVTTEIVPPTPVANARFGLFGRG